MIEALENALVDQLRDLLPEVEVEPYPDNPQDYVPSHPVGTVLVIFREAPFGADQGLARSVQEAVLTFEAVFLVRNLRTHQGVYAFMSRAVRGLQGWAAPGCDRTLLGRINFQHQRDGLWQYGLTVSMKTVAVEANPPALSGFGLGEEFPDGSPLPSSPSRVSSWASDFHTP